MQLWDVVTPDMPRMTQHIATATERGRVFRMREPRSAEQIPIIKVQRSAGSSSTDAVKAADDVGASPWSRRKQSAGE